MRKTAAISKSKLWEKIKYKPHSEEQRAIHESEARFRIPCCGRRFGKSIFSGVEMTEACFIPESYYWICGPTYKLAEKEFRVVHHNFTRKLGLQKELKISYNVKQGDMRIEFPWDTILECVSATNPDSLLGEGLDGVIMSEAARHSMQTWEQYVEPALSDKRGWAIFPSTPKGYNWYKGLFDLGQSPDEPDYASWRLPTWVNTYRFPGGFDDPELQRIRRVASEAYWRQEYGAEFTAMVGKIYDEWNEQYHVTNIEYNPSWRNYWAVDFGFSAPFVCLDIMVDPEENVYVWREYQVTHMTTWDHAIALKARRSPDGFHMDGIFADPRGADGVETLKQHFRGVAANPVGWDLGIEAVKRWLKLQPNGKPKLLIDHSCTDLIRQMESLRKPDPKEGKNPSERQHDYDDHGPDALRYFFNEYFILGANSNLSDVYSPGARNEAEGFLTYHSGIKLDSPITYG